MTKGIANAIEEHGSSCRRLTVECKTCGLELYDTMKNRAPIDTPYFYESMVKIHSKKHLEETGHDNFHVGLEVEQTMDEIDIELTVET